MRCPSRERERERERELRRALSGRSPLPAMYGTVLRLHTKSCRLRNHYVLYKFLGSPSSVDWNMPLSPLAMRWESRAEPRTVVQSWLVLRWRYCRHRAQPERPTRQAPGSDGTRPLDARSAYGIPVRHRRIAWNERHNSRGEWKWEGLRIT